MPPSMPNGKRNSAFAVVFGIGALGACLPFGMSTTLLPAQIALIAPHVKVLVLGALTAAGSLASLLFTVIFGALSDLTRTRFGARAPWILGGGLAAAGCLALLSTAHSVPMLFVWWCLFHACNGALTPAVLAIIPDRVPLANRGGISSAYGVGILTAASIGAVVGAQFLGAPGKGMIVMAIISSIFATTSVFLAPDRSNLGVKRDPISVRAVLATFAFPKKAPDFYWAFWGRLAIVLGCNMISTYQLYIITDYIHLGQAAATKLISIGSGINFLTSLLASGFAGPISDRIKRRKLPVIVASLIFAVAIVIPFTVPTANAMLAYFTLAGIGFGIYFSVDAALMSEVLPNKLSYGKDLGILNVANTTGGVLAPALSSLLVGIGIGFAPVFITAFALAILGAFTVMPIKSVR